MPLLERALATSHLIFKVLDNLRQEHDIILLGHVIVESLLDHVVFLCELANLVDGEVCDSVEVLGDPLYVALLLLHVLPVLHPCWLFHRFNAPAHALDVVPQRLVACLAGPGKVHHLQGAN